MIDDPVLVDEWHVVARSDDVPEEGVAAARPLPPAYRPAERLALAGKIPGITVNPGMRFTRSVQRRSAG